MGFGRIADWVMSSALTVPEFLQKLKPFFNHQGYEFSPWLNQFRQHFEGGFRNIILGFSEYEDVTILECTFGVRIHLVEETIMPYSNGINGYKDESSTGITNLAKFKNRKHYRLQYATEQESEACVQELKDFFLENGFPFLHRLSHLPTLEAYYNTAPSEPHLLSFSPRLRGFRGMVLAALVQNPEWHELRERYRQLMIRQGTPLIIQERFEQLCKQLRVMGPN